MMHTVRVASTLVVLVHGSILFAQAQLPDGFEFVQITDDEVHDSSFRINECGQIVFSKRADGTFEGEEIFLYDNGVTVQITDNDVQDRIPKINDAGVIVWQDETTLNPEFDHPLMKYEDGLVTQFAEGIGPHINNQGHVAFERFNSEGCSDANIFFYDGETIEQITEDAMSSQINGINDQDEIVWTQHDFCPFPWESEIMLYSGGEIIQLTVDSFEAQVPRINNQGVVAWSADGYPDTKFIEVWEDGEISLLTDWGQGSSINDLGDIVFGRWDEDLEIGYAWLHQKATDPTGPAAVSEVVSRVEIALGAQG